MSQDLQEGSAQLSVAALRRIHEVCEEFSWHLKSPLDGRLPRKEDYAARMSDPAEREELLRGLEASENEHLPQWFYALNNKKKVGPLSLSQLRQLADAGQLPPAQMVRREGMMKWVPACTVLPGIYRVAEHELLDVLGKGGNGVVYKARNLRLNRIVALKMILGGAAGADELARFQQEAEAVARVRHPNIVEIFEIGGDGKEPYLSLECAEGGNLKQRLPELGVPALDPRTRKDRDGNTWSRRRLRRRVRQAAALVEPLARAADHAHKSGLIHQDLKPLNVLLTKDGTPKIADFGLARWTRAGDGAAEPGVPVSQAVARIRSRPDVVVTEVIAGLDQWAYVRRIENRDGVERLFELANAVDRPDPRRCELRRLLASSRPVGRHPRMDRQRLTALAAEVNPATEPTLSLLVFSRALWEVDEKAKIESFFNDALWVRPKDPLLRAHLGMHHLMCAAHQRIKPWASLISSVVGTRGALPLEWWKAGRPAPADGARHVQDAITAFEALRTVRSQARLPLAVLLLETPRRAAAVEMIQQLERERVDDAVLQLLEAFALLKDNRAGAARAAEKAARTAGDSNLAHMARLIQILTALDAREWPKVEELSREVLRSCKQPAILFLANIGLGASLGKQGRTADCLRAFAEASQVSQGIPSGHVFLAQMLEMARETALAEKLLLRGRQEDPANPFVVVYLIEFLRRHRKTTQTADHRRALAQISLPDDATSLSRLAGALVRIGEFALAEKAYRKLLELDPHSAEARAYLAGVLNSFGKFREAEKHATKATELQPNEYMGHYMKGWALGGQNRPHEAEVALRKAVSLEDKVPDPILLLGTYLYVYRLGSLEEAERLLRTGLSRDPTHSSGNYARSCRYLGEVLRAQGKDREAEGWLRKAKELQHAGAG